MDSIAPDDRIAPSSNIQPSQFIYGKYVGDNHPYELLAWTPDLESYRDLLISLIERDFHFWGSQNPLGDIKAVALLPNKTGILKSKENIVVQVAPAVDQQGHPVTSGGRKFNQFRIIFFEETFILPLRKSLGLFLLNFKDDTIPIFSEISSNYDSWSTLNLNYSISVLNPSYSDQADFFRLHLNHIIPALSFLFNNQRLLLTIEDADMHPIKFVDYLLRWLPGSYRNKVGLAIGSVDETYCTWVNIVVKLNGRPDRALPPDLIWLNGNRVGFSSAQKTLSHHKFVAKAILEPIENQWIEPDKLIEFLDTLDEENFTPSSPSVNFFLKFTKIAGLNQQQLSFFLREFFPEIRNQLHSFLLKEIDDLKADDQQLVLCSLWNVIQGDDLLPLLTLKKLLAVNEEKFLEVTESDLFIQYIPALLASDFLISLDATKYPHIIDIIRESTHRLISGLQTYDSSINLIKLCQNLGRAFTVEDLYWLADSTLSLQPSLDQFKRLFIHYMVPYLPFLEASRYEQSHVYSYLKLCSPIVANNFSLLLRIKDKGGMQNLIIIAKELEIGPAETQSLYIAFINSWQPEFEQGIPIIINCIKTSLASDLTFNMSDFMPIYEYFESTKSGLLSCISGIFCQPTYWQTWNELIDFLGCQNTSSAIVLFDAILGRHFCPEMLQLWLNILSQLDTSDLRQKFLTGSTWKSVKKNEIKEVLFEQHDDYNALVTNLFLWAYQEKKSLIEDVFLDYFHEKWTKQGKLDHAVWNVLIDDATISCFGNDYWIRLFNLSISLNQYLPMSKYCLSNKDVQVMYSHARVVIGSLRLSSEIDALLCACSTFDLRPLAIIQHAIPEACSISLFRKYIDLADERDDGFLPGCLALCRQIAHQRQDKTLVKELIGIGLRIIGILPQGGKQSSLEILLSTLSTLIDSKS
jgi:hypothetical protein